MPTPIGRVVILLIFHVCSYLSFAFGQTTQCHPVQFDLPTQFESGRSAVAIVSLDIDGDGLSDAITSNSSDRTVSLILGAGRGEFGPPQTFPTGINADWLSVRDLNSDGHRDVVVASKGAHDQIAILINDGNAGFQPPVLVPLPVREDSFAVETGDFNGDGRGDIVVVMLNKLVFLTGTAQGGFTAFALDWGGYEADIAIGRVNGDAIDDIIVTGPGNALNLQFGVILGTAGSSQFSLNATYPLEAEPADVRISDINGDGFADVLLAISDLFPPFVEPRNYVQVWRGNGTTDLTPLAKHGIQQKIEGVVVADFDSDGKRDVGINAYGLFVKLDGIGDSSFSTPKAWMSTGSRDIAATDTNSDGRDDVITIRPGEPSFLSVLLAEPGGEFNTQKPLLNGGTHIVAVDLNNDGFKEMITAAGDLPTVDPTSGITIALNDQNGGFLPDVSYPTAVNIRSLGLINLNNSGPIDIFTTHGNPNIVTGYTSGAGAISQVPNLVTWFNNVDGLVPGDLNGDGNQDFLMLVSTDAFVFLGNGNGGFQNINHTLQNINIFAPPRVGDMNEDGKLDIVAVNNNQNTLLVFTGLGDGRFGAPSTFPTIAGFDGYVLSDFNNDGHLDLGGVGSGGAEFTVGLSKYFGTGAGGFSGSAFITMPGAPLSTVAADFDGDGLSDLAFVSLNTNGSLIVVPSTPQAPYFETPLRYSVGPLASNFFLQLGSITAADYDSDGRVDIGYSGNNIARGFIRNITSPTLPCISVADVTVDENDSSGNAVFTVTLSQPAPSGGVRFNFALGRTTATFEDIQNRYGRIEVPAGQTSVAIAVPITGDLLDEFDEEFSLTLSGIVGAFPAKATAIGRIVDNDPIPSLTISDFEHTETAFAQQAVLTLALSAPSGKSIEVRYTTANGSAISGSDYPAVSAIKNIPPGTSSISLPIQIFTDTMYEPTEDFFVNLTDPINVTIGDAQARITILDDDPVPVVSIVNHFFSEGNSGTVSRTITVRLANSSYLPVSASVRSVDNTAMSGVDYVPVNANVTFSPGQVQTTILVGIIGDTIDEPNETFNLEIFGPSNATVGTNIPVVTINDDDLAAPATISGRVLTPSGLGLRNTTVTLISAEGVSLIATTSSFGVYSIGNIQTVGTYTLRVSSKRYRFSSRTINISGDITDINFIGLE